MTPRSPRADRAHRPSPVIAKLLAGILAAIGALAVVTIVDPDRTREAIKPASTYIGVSNVGNNARDDKAWCRKEILDLA